MTAPSVLVPLPCPFCQHSAMHYKRKIAGHEFHYAACDNFMCHMHLKPVIFDYWNKREMIATAKEETPLAFKDALDDLENVEWVDAACNGSCDAGYDCDEASDYLTKHAQAIRAALSQSKDAEYKKMIEWLLEELPTTMKLDDCKIPELLRIKERMA